MEIKIPGLLEIISLDRVTEVLLDAYAEHPVYAALFPARYERNNAIEITIRYYGQYDMFYGKAYTLDEEVFEVALVIDSANAKMSKNKCLKAGCYSLEYQDIKLRMSPADRKKRIQLFNEMLKLRKKVKFPKRYLSIDYLGVAEVKQGAGRGTELMQKICDYADSMKLPLILFVNSDECRDFFEKFGFSELTEVRSDKFGFTNIYLIREEKEVKNV